MSYYDQPHFGLPNQSPWDALEHRPTKPAPKKRGTRPQVSKAEMALKQQKNSSFNTQIPSRAAQDRTNSIRGRT